MYLIEFNTPRASFFAKQKKVKHIPDTITIGYDSKIIFNKIVDRLSYLYDGEYIEIIYTTGHHEHDLDYIKTYLKLLGFKIYKIK